MRFRYFVLVLLLLGAGACTSERDGGMGGRSSSSDAIAAGAATATATATLGPTDTAAPPTLTPTITLTPSPGPSSTPTDTPTPTLTPTDTATPTSTPTSVPQSNPFLPVLETPERLLTATPATAIPTRIPQFDVPSSVTNILLLGSDTPVGEGVGRTDTIIIVSIDRDQKTASMVSIPRDMYVYIPGRGMGRINTALAYGVPGYRNGAVGLLEDTILYNFGVPIHYYARIDFAGFESAVDAIGGVDVPVSCAFEDHRLKSPNLDPEDEENWELFRIEPGIQEMDGATALWYVRSRESIESDWGRHKRQQQVLRALFNQGVDLNLLPQVPELYNAYRDTVDTNLDIGRILQLAAIAPAVRDNGIQHLYIFGDQLQPFAVPIPGQEQAMHVQLPNWENLQWTFYRLFTPPALNSGARAPIYVEIVNGTDNPDLAELAADNLAWYGFVPVITEADGQDYESTSISYYDDNFKGAFEGLLSWIFGLRASDVALVPDSAYEYDYRVVIGDDYDPCVNRLYSPPGS